jgi:hypothetical protein
VEQTLAWIERARQLSKAYERNVQTSETLVAFAAICFLLLRLHWST